MLRMSKRPGRLRKMTRKPRLGLAERSTISRRNYRRALLEQRGAAAFFEKTLFEAMRKVRLGLARVRGDEQPLPLGAGDP